MLLSENRYLGTNYYAQTYTFKEVGFAKMYTGKRTMIFI